MIRSIINGFRQIQVYFIGEVKEIFRDSGTVVLFIIAMLAYPVIYAIGYMEETATEIPVAFVNLNDGALSHKLGRMIDATEQVRIVSRVSSLQEAEELYYRNEVAGVIVVDRDFEKDILSGRQGNVSVYSDASHFLLYKQVYSATVYASQTLGAAVEVNSLINKGKTMEQALVMREPLSIKTYNLYNPAGGYASFIVPAILIILVQQTLLIGIGLLYGKHNERRSYHYLKDGMRRPFEEIKIIIGQTMAFMLIYLVTTFLIMGLFYRWMALPDKSGLLNTYLLMIPYLAAVSFMGISIGLLFSKRVYALLFLVFLSPILFFISGVAWPVEALPPLLYKASYILPSTPMVNAFIRLRVMGASLQSVSPEFNILLVQMLAYFLLAAIVYRIKLKRLRQEMAAL
ncbi:ABC transporter permease [Haoranjiania flava]|uniref:ABC transporter permease n=1 Tax=Haoranjiania flava TaxID=1856322 RepID=A0AAE3IN97_9BACT|nr:ABC transporter permease [Haoranjiania flava]MCU7694759.1 ABC transporter permease [Haoranjiania flava]